MDIKKLSQLNATDKAMVNALYCLTEHILRERVAEEYCAQNFMGETTCNIMKEQLVPFIKFLDEKADDYIDSIIRDCSPDKEDLKNEENSKTGIADNLYPGFSTGSLC